MNAYDTLTGRVRGPVLTPGDDGYDDERSGFQTALEHRPAVIVGAAGAEDVRAAVEFAAGQGLAVAVQATGHGLGAATEGGLLISTRRMTGVRVDPAERTAWFAAGVVWSQVIEAAAPHGLAPLSGSAPHVGAVSYTLGGGLGLLSRRYGYAADHVRAIEVVTADGRLRHVTVDGDPDLFWALRGGKDNFGVVTGMEVDLLPVSRLYGGGLYFDAELVPEVVSAYRGWTRTVPDEMTSAVGTLTYPDLPMLPEPLRGRYAAHVRIAYAGDPADGERLVAPLRDLGPRLIDTVTDMPYAESGSIFSDPARPHGYVGDNVLLRDLDDEAVRSVLKLTAPYGCIVDLRHLGGALSRPPAVPSAVGHRDALYILRVLSVADDADAAKAAREVHQRVYDVVAPLTVGRNTNFVYGHADTDGVHEEAGRLAALKAVYDPANLFRHNQNIAPRPA